jgi:hypothetical protein
MCPFAEAQLPDLHTVIIDARGWLKSQPIPVSGSATWYGFNSLRAFLSQIETDPSPHNLERACHALGRHISDQYGAYEELPTIAAFNDRDGASQRLWHGRTRRRGQTISH